MAYEDRHRPFFEAVFYDSEEARAERIRLAEELGPRRDEMCGHVRAFLAVAPGTIGELRGRIAELLGHAPRSPVYFVVALQWTDGRAHVFEGRHIVALNARHDTFARTSGLAVTVAHELIHDVQGTAANGEDERLPPMARALFREGGAVYAVQQLFPEVANRALGLRPEQVERANSMAPRAAGELLEVLTIQDAEPHLRRFFQGGSADPLFPPKMGYYLGHGVFRSLAQRQGDARAARATPGAFLAEAKAHLLTLSRQPSETSALSLDAAGLSRLRDDFLARARTAGLVLPFTPEMREWTRPSMISWRQEARAVAVPRWDELSQPQRELVARMAGDNESEARRLFDCLFRWFLVAHELTHAFQDNLAVARLDHATSERLANDVALAFFHEDPQTRPHLFALAPTIMGAANRLPSLAEFPSDEALNRYFDQHYDELGRDPPRYGAFQLRFILDSFRRIDRLRFDEGLRRAVGH